MQRPDRLRSFSFQRAPRRGWRAIAPLVALAAALAAFSANAQNLFATVLKVNDAIISGYDVDQRMRLIALERPNIDKAELEARALEALVADQLKLQEAEKQGLTISDAQLNDAVRSVAERNQQSEETMLGAMAERGVSEETFRNQIRADLAWNELVRRRFGGRVAPTEEEIDAAIAGSPQSGAVRYDVRQIVVPLRPNAAEDLVRRAFEEAVRVRRELTIAIGSPNSHPAIRAFRRSRTSDGATDAGACAQCGHPVRGRRNDAPDPLAGRRPCHHALRKNHGPG